MKLSVITPYNPEAAYFSNQVLSSLPRISTNLIGALSTVNPLMYLANKHAVNDLLAHHLVDDEAVRIERILLGSNPGVTFVHDLFLTSHGPEPILNSGFSSTVELINLKSKGLEFPPRDIEYSREKYYAIRELSLSLLPIFTDAVAHAKYLTRDHPTINVASAYIPWPATVAVNSKPGRRVSADSPLRVGISNGARISSHAHQVLRAIDLCSIRDRIVINWMIRGEAELARAENLCRSYPGVTVRFIPQRSPDRWAELIEDLDVAVHLHFGMFESVGPYLPLSLASGLPCIVSDECASWLPQDAAIFIRAGNTEVGELREAFEQLGKGSLSRNSIATDFVNQYHCPSVVQNEICFLLERHESALREKLSALGEVQRAARGAVLSEISSESVLSPIFAELGWGNQDASDLSREFSR